MSIKANKIQYECDGCEENADGLEDKLPFGWVHAPSEEEKQHYCWQCWSAARSAISERRTTLLREAVAKYENRKAAN